MEKRHLIASKICNLLYALSYFILHFILGEGHCLGRIAPNMKHNMTVLFVGETISPLLPLWLMTNLNCTSVFTFSPITLDHSFER